MEKKPVYYDGSVKFQLSQINESVTKLPQITNEIRKSIGCNPYQANPVKR
ncbi:MULTISPECIES: hypothetical protein [unclassified Bacillus (in: firmicutes)]|nr:MULTISPECIES: hypothetical protein [unclassified Bacillus (in: firmicutes)]CAH0343953.1 hypothetical protein BCI9360_00180 [Bacillus sp. CECT 9360]